MSQDPRVEKSRQALLEGYLRLAKTVETDRITVAGLCREAGVSRYTFYAHYQDLADFLTQSKTHIIDEIIDILVQNYTFDTDTTQLFGKTVDYYLENADLVFTILGPVGSPDFTVLHERLKDLTLPHWEAESALPREKLEQLFEYHICGATAFFYHWWKSGYGVDADSLKELYTGVAKYGLYNFIYTV